MEPRTSKYEDLLPHLFTGRKLQRVWYPKPYWIIYCDRIGCASYFIPGSIKRIREQQKNKAELLGHLLADFPGSHLVIEDLWEPLNSAVGGDWVKILDYTWVVPESIDTGKLLRCLWHGMWYLYKSTKGSIPPFRDYTTYKFKDIERLIKEYDLAYFLASAHCDNPWYLCFKPDSLNPNG